MPIPSSPIARSLPRQTQLRILATTDLHLHLFPYDYHADQPTDAVGLARTATLIREARAEVEHSVLLDNGDFLLGNPMGDHLARQDNLGSGAIHPMIAAMNLLEYDAVALGNHEFDLGLDYLANTLKAAHFPVLCANVEMTDLARCAFRPWTLLERTIRFDDGQLVVLRLGVIGLVPPQITVWNQAPLKGQLLARDMVEVAIAMLPQIRAAGADVIVALAHTGIGALQATPGMENAATALAGLPEIDAVVAGHSHLVFPAPAFERSPGVDPVGGTLSGKPAVMAGFGGSHLGVIDLALTHDGTGWTIAGTQSAVRPIYLRTRGWSAKATVASAVAVLNVAATDHSATLSHVRRPIGKSEVDLNTYFSLVTPSACSVLVAEAQRAHVVACLQGTEHETLPVLSAVSPFKAGGRGGVSNYIDIAKGEIALRHLSDIYPFPNTIRAARVSGAFLVDWLERSASLYHQITPGISDQTLIDPHFASYNFDTIHGLSYKIDVSQPARFSLTGLMRDPKAHRIVDVRLNGAPVERTDRLVVATNSYRTAGLGDDMRQLDNCATILESLDQNRDILVRHVADHGTIRPSADQSVWQFVRLPETSVLFDTSPKALRYLDQLDPRLRIRPAGWGDDGFARFRIEL